MSIKQALISVSDKTGIIELAQNLAQRYNHHDRQAALLNYLMKLNSCFRGQ